MITDFSEILDKSKQFVVFGASRDETKYGFRVLKKLIDNGYKALPINPNADEVYGQEVFGSIGEIDLTVDTASVVTPPKISLGISKEAIAKGIKNIWFQPGAYDDDVLEFLKDKDINVIAGPCILVEVDNINL